MGQADAQPGSEPERPLAFRARLVFPVDGPPIEGGIVTISGARIVAVGENLSGQPPLDLPGVAIVPGFVNAHTHLEFSLLERPLGSAGMPFFEWIGQVVAYRAAHVADGEGHRRQAIARGLAEALATGTTTLGEIATGGWSIADRPIPDVTLFHEVIGLDRSQFDERSAAAAAHLSADWDAAHVRPGLSPHAPYTVSLEQLQALREIAAPHAAPLAMHVAESEAELELLQHGTGPLRRLLEERGVWHAALAPTADEDLVAAMLRELALSGGLVVHGHLLDPRHRDQIAAAAKRLSVVYCPRTHRYFDRPSYPLDSLLARGIAVAIGTDSRASNPDLDMLGELREVRTAHPEVDSSTALELGTIAGAQALGRAAEIGTLCGGKFANLAMIAVPERTADDPHELLWSESAHVVETWWRGQCVYRK